MKKQVNKYEVRTDLFYDPENHFWLDIDGTKAVIGMSPLVQETSGSFVAVQFAAEGTVFSKNKSFGTIEAEKHVGPLKSPVAGVVLAINSKVVENPRLINDDPYGEGWLMEIELTQPEDISSLISGETEILGWFESELRKFDEKGWIAN